MITTSKTKHVLIYEKLRQQIIKGKLRPGQKMVIADLARRFDSSETPVREAIRRLQSEGHLVFTPHTGAVVSKIDKAELAEIYLIRISLETLAARLAVGQVNGRDIEWLRKKNNEMKTAMEKANYYSLASLNRAFHLRIYKAAPYPRLYRMIVDLWDAFERWPSIFSYVPQRVALSIQEHDRIIEALAAADAELVEKLMKEQKERAFVALNDFIGTGNNLAGRAAKSSRKKNLPNKINN
jgi:DNA-binding GntR family transcriptional regulator